MAMLRGQHATEVPGGVLFRMEAIFFLSFLLSSYIFAVKILSHCRTECRRSVLRLINNPCQSYKTVLSEHYACELFPRLCALDRILCARCETASSRGDAAEAGIQSGH